MNIVRHIADMMVRDGEYTPNQIRVYSMMKRRGGRWYMDEIDDACPDVIDVPAVVRSLVDTGWLRQIIVADTHEYEVVA